METSVQSLHQNRVSSLLARPWASRLVATLGIVLMTIGLYVPVAGRDVLFHGDPVSRSSETWAISDSVGANLAWLHLERMPISGLLGIEAMFAVLTLGGLALIPLLWQSPSPRGTTAIRLTYTAWLILLVMLAVAGLSAWWQFMTQPPLELPSPSQAITLAASYSLPGAVVFPLGLLISCFALALMRNAPLPVSPPATVPRTGWQCVAALVLSVGVLVWLIGFYLMPEAVTAACPPVSFSVTQFAHGACAGLDSDQVLTAASNAGLNPIARLLVPFWGYTFLVATGCITALGGWTRRLSVSTLTWLAVWPVLALGVALVALQGVSVIARQGFKLIFETGADWHVGSGTVVTFAGIGLVVLGQLGLWREWVRHSSSRDRHLS
jgi:hypothetical protein